MPMSNDEAAELTASFKLLSADELRAQLGDNDEEDALINAVLGEGRAVETKGSKNKVDDDADDADADDADKATEGKKKPVVEDDDDDADDADDDAAAKGKKADAPAGDDTTTVDDGNTIDGTDLVKDVSAEVIAPNIGFLSTELQTGLKALDAGKAEQLGKLMSGEIEAAEYSEYESKYMADRDALKDEHQQRVEWVKEVHGFQVEVARTTGINYTTDKDKASALDDWTKRLASKPENADKEGNWFLQEAHRKVMAEFGIAAPVAKDASAAEVPKKAKASRAPDLSGIPPSLGGLPAAAEAQAGDAGEFAGLDRLSGMAYETALARMTPAQKERYEAM